MIKKCSVLILFLCMLTLLQAQKRYTYKVEKVTDDIYVLEPEINSYRWVTANIVVIINDEDVFVVDSGLLPSAAEDAIAEIKKLTTKPVRYLLNTHWHGDHWQGNEVFAKKYPGIHIIASEKNKTAIERNGMAWVNMFYSDYFKRMLADDVKNLETDKTATTKNLSEKQRNDLIQGIEEVKKDSAELGMMKPVVPNMTFSDKMVIHSGIREIQLHYLGIGNTVGDAIVYLPKEKILVAGDMVVYPSPYESGAFSMEWINTSAKLQNDFRYDQLIPGHGSVQKDTLYLTYLNALFQELAKQMNAAFIAGKTDVPSAKSVITHKTVTDELNKDPRFIKYTRQLDPNFVPSAITDAFRSIVIKGVY